MTVVVGARGGHSHNFIPLRRYEGESPDEVALVHAAAAHGCKLQARNSEYVTVALPGKFVGHFSESMTDVSMNCATQHTGQVWRGKKFGGEG